MVNGDATNLKANWAGQQIFINLVNSGNTPARAVVIQTGIHDWPEDLPKGYQFPLDNDKIQATVGPKAQYSTDRIISKDAILQNWHGKARIFIWGTIVYRDIFPDDPERLTEFCTEMTHVTAGWITAPKTPPVKGPSLDDLNTTIATAQNNACKEHNCYDEDCYDYQSRIKDMRE
jgi:hypothetical protein